ncbi:MAG TPA: acetate--CoA ligase family protein [Thermomicrobiales bacterium]|nr:acetate--CoA ligase family protein [Thermomicrobiales bacterium]
MQRVSRPDRAPGERPAERWYTDWQEPAAFARAMRALLHPRRIAIVGASPNRGFANSIQRRLVECGYDGEIFPVNPNYREVMGLPTYPTLEAIPGGAELAIVVVPGRMVLEVLDACERAGVGAVNIITSGFAEKQEDETGPARQRAIRDFARRTGIRVVGPNCLGNISVRNTMVASSGAYPPLTAGPISLALQSGLLAYSLVIPPHDRGIGFNYVVTSGNEADIDLVDILRFYVDDEETRVIGCFVEQIRRPAEFLEVAAAAAERRKPIVMLKVGRSETAQRAALAHTGSLVGADGIADAVIRQYGIARVYSLEEMIETLAIFHSRKLPRGRGAAMGVSSGGTAGLIADMAHDVGVDFPALAPATAERIEAVIPPYGTVGNPLDWTGQAGRMEGVLAECFSALADDPHIAIVIYGQAYPTVIDLTQAAGAVLRTLPERYPDTIFLVLASVPGVVKWRTFDADPVEPALALDGIPFLHGAENGLRAVRALIRYAEFQRAWTGTRAARLPPTDPAVGRQAGLPQAGSWGATPSAAGERARALVRAAGGRPLVERAAKEILALYDIPVTRERLATSPEDAVAAARAIGYPVVLKIESPDITHKTDAGGVLLDVASDEAVREGFARIVASARAYAPRAELGGVLVQEQAAPGHELILGMTQDATFGPAIAVGLGGIFVETLQDVALGVPPLREWDARAMLARLRAAPILAGHGARGRAPADLDALVATLTRFSQLCLDLRADVSEIDINPLLVYEAGRGVRVVDCLIVPRREA